MYIYIYIGSAVSGCPSVEMVIFSYAQKKCVEHGISFAKLGFMSLVSIAIILCFATHVNATLDSGHTSNLYYMYGHSCHQFFVAIERTSTLCSQIRYWTSSYKQNQELNSTFQLFHHVKLYSIELVAPRCVKHFHRLLSGISLEEHNPPPPLFSWIPTLPPTNQDQSRRVVVGLWRTPGYHPRRRFAGWRPG